MRNSQCLVNYLRTKMVLLPWTIILIMCLSQCAWGQSETPAQKAASPAPADKDKSGVNPLVLRPTISVSNEYYNLPGEGLHNNITKFRLVIPFAGNQASITLTTPINVTNTSVGFFPSGTDGPVDRPPLGVVPGNIKAGLGDLALKFTYIAYFNHKLKLGLATGLELGFETATKPLLGTGKNTIAPSLTVVTFPFKQTIFAPTYKQTNSYSGSDLRKEINQGVFDLYFVRVFNKGRNNLTIDPQLVLNYESGKFSSVVESTIGFVMSPENGVSFTVTAGLPVGGNRPYDFAVKIGLKKVW